jgi:hypothetical protein
MSVKSMTIVTPQRANYGFVNEDDRKFPNMVHLDLINVCNMRCIHCPQANILEHVPDYRANQLDFDLFRKIIAEVARHRATLRITCDGEPFLYKHIVEAIEYIKSAGVAYATITTNGSVLTPRAVDAILKPSDTKLVVDFSLDSLYRQSYARIRRRGDYLKVYGNVFMLLRKKKLDPNLRVVVNLIDQESLEPGEVEAFKSFWSPLADDVVIRTYLNVKGMVNASDLKMNQDQYRWPCSLLWNRIAISSYGRPRFCVADWREQAAFGDLDLRRHTISELWQSDRYDQLRRLHLEREFDKLDICRDCTDWFGLKWDYDYKIVMNRLFASESSPTLERTLTDASTT